MVTDSSNGHDVQRRVSPSGPNDPPKPTFMDFNDLNVGTKLYRERKEIPHPRESFSNLHSCPRKKLSQG